ncbi:MAG: trehalose operon repressor [Lachnospiraceae bacterium]|nr:trehalose operon repressor [Lachnospiraceae bacterium]
MPAAKYGAIYHSLRRAIESGEYSFQQALPSEHKLIEMYDCSRNTVRRAIRQLAEESYVQSVHGKGVIVIYRKTEQTQFSISGIESMKEAAERNHLPLSTKVICFEEMIVSREDSLLTGFPEGAPVYHVIRVRYLGGEAQIIDHNYFLKEVLKGLTSEIAAGSIYEYMENTLGETIVTTRRKYTVEHPTALDEQYMDLKGYQAVAQVSSQTFNKDGIQFEFTCSRHRPDRFVFYEVAQRKPEMLL